MKYEILKQDEKLKVKVTLSNFNQPSKSIQELERMGIVKEIADISKVYELLSKDGYTLGEGIGPKISNFSNGCIITGIYEFDNLDPNRPKPAIPLRKSTPRKKEETLIVKNNPTLEKAVQEPDTDTEPELSNKTPTPPSAPQKKNQPKTMKRRSNN